MYNKEEIRKFLEDSIEWLKDQDIGCTTYKLDDKLAICVGWLPGYGEDKRDDCIQSVSEPDYAINAGIKVYTSDDMRTDYEFINAPYYDNGDVLMTDVSIEPNADLDALVDYFEKEYNSMIDLEIEDDGRIIEKSEEEPLEEAPISGSDNLLSYNNEAKNILANVKQLIKDKKSAESVYDLISENMKEDLKYNIEHWARKGENLTTLLNIYEKCINEFKNAYKEEEKVKELNDTLNKMKNLIDNTKSTKEGLEEKKSNGKGEKIAQLIAKALKGECGPFGGENPKLQGNKLGLHSQMPTEWYVFNDDGSVDFDNVEEIANYLNAEEAGFEGDELEKANKSFVDEFKHFDSVKDLLYSDLSWFEMIDDSILDKVDAILGSKEESCNKKEVKESWEGESIIDDLIERAQSMYDDSEYCNIDECVAQAIDDGLIYSDDILELAKHYGTLPDDSDLISDFYEDLFSDIYAGIEEHEEEEEDEEEDDFEDDEEEIDESLKESKGNPNYNDVKVGDKVLYSKKKYNKRNESKKDYFKGIVKEINGDTLKLEDDVVVYKEPKDEFDFRFEKIEEIKDPIKDVNIFKQGIDDLDDYQLLQKFRDAKNKYLTLKARHGGDAYPTKDMKRRVDKLKKKLLKRGITKESLRRMSTMNEKQILEMLNSMKALNEDKELTDAQIQEVIDYLKDYYDFTGKCEFIEYNAPEAAIGEFNFEDVADEYDSVEDLLDPKNNGIDGFNFDTMRNTPENLKYLITKHYDEIKDIMDFVKGEERVKFNIV